MYRSIVKNLLFSISSIIVVLLLSSVILLGSASILITPNTAAYVWFNVSVDDESWLDEPKYNWKNDEQIDPALVHQKWVNYLQKISIDYYTVDFILLNFAQAVNSDVNTDASSDSQFDNSIFDVFESEQVVLYVNEFVRQQAGYLIGNNALPIPNRTDLNTILCESVANYGSGLTKQWFVENKSYVTESFLAVLLSTNELFDQKILETDTSFAESVLILKILNLNVCIWIALGIVIVLSCTMSFSQNRLLFYVYMAINQLCSCLLSIICLFGLKDITFVVVNGSISLTEQMFSHMQTSLFGLPIAYFLLSILFAILAIHKKWGVFRSLQSFWYRFVKIFQK